MRKTWRVSSDGTAQKVLIDAAGLRRWLTAGEPPAVLDVRWRLGGPSCRTEYGEGHVPGAVFVELDDDLCGPPGPAGRHPLPDPEHLQAALRRAGLSAGQPVVVYDGGDGLAAARTWWTLRWAGGGDVRVLDGGYPAWLAADAAISRGEEAPEPGDVVVRPGGMSVVDADGASRIAAEGVLVDVRAPARYRGESEPIDPVAGHIPGAVNLPTTGNVGPGGTFLPAAELRERFAREGLGPSVVAGAYCGSGITAAHTVLAMTVAGYPAALYVGSWSEWITDAARPVATGDPAPEDAGS